jgi:oxygen-independent coproporphyrinogen-3 oxidase
MEGMQFCYPEPQWFAQALGSSYVEPWIKASRQPYWYRPAKLAVLAPPDPRSIGGRGDVGDVGDDEVRAARLAQEMALFARLHGARAGVAEVFWSAEMTTLSEPALRVVRSAMSRCFDMQAQADFTARIAQTAVRPSLLSTLRECGVTTLQTSVSPAHAHPLGCLERFVAAARREGFRSIAVDLPLADPHVSVQTAREWVEAVRICRPNRVFLARPWARQAAKSHTRAPDADRRLQRIWQEAFASLIAAGYEHIAHDAFAVHVDELANAKRLATLAPWCYGYSTCISHASIAIGEGAVGNVGPMQYQNCRDSASYASMLEREGLPVERGLLTSADRLVRRTIMAGLLTNFCVDIEAIEQCYGIDFRAAFRSELVALELLEREGFVETDAKQVRVTPIGRFACCRVANVFDR